MGDNNSELEKSYQGDSSSLYIYILFFFQGVLRFIDLLSERDNLSMFTQRWEVSVWSEWVLKLTDTLMQHTSGHIFL